MGKALTKQSTEPDLRPRPVDIEMDFEAIGTQSVLENLDGRRKSHQHCCFAYELQPHCTENRHFHASVCKSIGILIQDLTYNKEWTIGVKVNKKHLIPGRVMRGSGLTHCTIIGFSKGIIVIQCFYQRSIHFFICDLNTSRVLNVYERHYQGQEKLHLFECYMSQDTKYIILKKNSLFCETSYSAESTTKDFILLRMSPEMTSSEDVSLPDLSFERTAVMFEPSVPTTSFIIGRMNTCGPKLYRIILRKDAAKATETINSACAADSAKYSVLQHVPDKNLVILSVLRYFSSSPFSHERKSSVTNYMYDLELGFKGQFSYTSPLGYRFFAPVFSPSGKFLSCAQQIVSLVSTPRLKTLKETCRSLLRELVLSEDIVKLPIPQSLVKYIHCNN